MSQDAILAAISDRPITQRELSERLHIEGGVPKHALKCLWLDLVISIGITGDLCHPKPGRKSRRHFPGARRDQRATRHAPVCRRRVLVQYCLQKPVPNYQLPTKAIVCIRILEQHWQPHILDECAIHQVPKQKQKYQQHMLVNRLHKNIVMLCRWR